jgi:hypothetical protein
LSFNNSSFSILYSVFNAQSGKHQAPEIQVLFFLQIDLIEWGTPSVAKATAPSAEGACARLTSQINILVPDFRCFLFFYEKCCKNQKYVLE